MTDASSRGAGEILIKKYGNRRLYDTSQSRYITLDDLAEIVKQGATVRVVEASSERDLTRQVLTQVILEQQEALEMVPVELLHAIIRVRGTLEQAPFSAFLAGMTRQFVQSGQLWSQQLSVLFGGLPLGSAPRHRPAPPTPEPRGARPDGEDLPASEQQDPDLQDLRQRMDRLLGKLNRG